MLDSTWYGAPDVGDGEGGAETGSRVEVEVEEEGGGLELVLGWEIRLYVSMGRRWC